jgi:hypothetical protein
MQAAGSLAFVGLLIAVDWVLNRRLTYLTPAAIGIAVGLAGGLAVRLARRRRSGRA